MALAPQNQDAFFREVDDEVRRDQMVGFWQRYGKLVAGVVIAALVVLAGWLFWQHRRDQQAGAQGEALSQALVAADGPNAADANAKLAAIAGSGDAGYAAAARLTEAGLAANKGDAKAAAAGYARVAADAGAPQAFRDLALVRQTALEFDTLPPGTVIARLTPFATPGNAWFGSAGEMTGIAYLRQNKTAEAGRIFAAVAQDAGVPTTIAARARRIAGTLGVEVGAARERTQGNLAR